MKEDEAKEDQESSVPRLLYRRVFSPLEVERHLKRPLMGDPSRGERGVVSALRDARIDSVRWHLEHDDPELGADFKDLIRAQLRNVEQLWTTTKAWRIQVPQVVWEEYARESRMTQQSVADCLSAAVQRDYQCRVEASDPLEALRQEVRAYHAVATEILESLKVAAPRFRRDV
jgi:hypothetical protein